MMFTVKLYGHLGRKFGRIHRFDIATPAEAIRALKANIKEFGPYLVQHSEPGYRVITDLGERSAEQLGQPMGGNSLKIVPGIAGAGRGAGMFLAGAVLFAAGAYTGFTPLSQLGVAMMLGGVSQMLFTPPPHAPNPPGNLPSYAFSGAVNTTAQGNPVPVCYGRMLVGSQVISGGLYAAAI